MFPNLTLGAATTSQLVYVTPKCPAFSFPNMLRVTPLDFPAQAAKTGRVAECTAMDNETNNNQGSDHTTKYEVLLSTEWSTATHIAHRLV